MSLALFAAVLELFFVSTAPEFRVHSVPVVAFREHGKQYAAMIDTGGKLAANRTAQSANRLGISLEYSTLSSPRRTR